jgi:hypothetical protein
VKRRAPAGADERGLVLILVSLSITVVLVMAALVLDLSQLRTDRKVNKSVADMSARAGVGLLPGGPWPGVCRARAYLASNSRFSTFDGGSERWSTPTSPATALAASPCVSTTTAPFTTACQPNQPASWARLTATAGGGRYAIELQSGYALPDSRFPEDALAADTGDAARGSCDNLAVIIRETRSPIFAGVIDPSSRTTTIRSVGRLSQAANPTLLTPALLLLEQHRCSVLTVTSNGARVIAQAVGDQPGLIQIDSADDQGGCSQNQAVLNGKATSSGPSILACSAKTASPTSGCNVASSDSPGRIGINALSVPHGAGDFVTSGYPGTYGDTRAVPSPQAGRLDIDRTYRSAVAALDGDARSVITANGGKPPGCSTVVNGSCTSTDGSTWVVLQQADCNGYPAFFSAARAAAARIWLNCALDVTSPLTLSAASSTVVITGSLSVRSTFAITDPAKLYVGGKSTGNKVGLDLGNGGDLNVGNPTPGAPCPSGPTGRFSKIVVGDGSFAAASGASAHLCGAVVLLASGYGKVPVTDGTPPCSSPCSGYLGTMSIGSGSAIDWLAPNLFATRRPTDAERATSSPFEDEALWTEAGGGSSGVSGGGATRMTGVFFLGNADAFTLAGGSSADQPLSAQFVSRTMTVSGGAAVSLTPSPFGGVPFVVYALVLVR